MQRQYMPFDLATQGVPRGRELCRMVERQPPWTIGVGPLDLLDLRATHRMDLIARKERQEQLRDRPAARVAFGTAERRHGLKVREFTLTLSSAPDEPWLQGCVELRQALHPEAPAVKFRLALA
jgi:hypothetical protein